LSPDLVKHRCLYVLYMGDGAQWFCAAFSWHSNTSNGSAWTHLIVVVCA